jgi:pentatricopeptide repeat protein
MINGYAQHGLGHEALKCFGEMQDAKIRPNAVTYAGVLKACGIVGSLDVGEGIDAEVRKQGLLQNDVVLGTALVDMYTKCNALEKAREVFDHLPNRTIASWNALIGGYVQHGQGEEALKCFKEMQDMGISPDEVTYLCTLKACGIVGFLKIGENIVVEIRKQGLLKDNIMLGTALVDMYSKCGASDIALEVFEQLPVKNVVSWSTLITLYAHLGQSHVVMALYERMKTECVVPSSVTYTLLLTSCSHSGLVKYGEKLFEEMCVQYSLTPTLEHYSCMIDLFGRAGLFDMAKALLEKVSHSDHLPLFMTILGACRAWRNVKLGRWAFEHSIKLNDKCASAYITMENIYVGMEE